MATDFGKLEFEVSFESTSAFPIDKRTYFESYSDAVEAASLAKEAGDTTTYYYYGQIFSIYDPDSKRVSFHQILSDNTLKKIGTDHFNSLTEAQEAVVNAVEFGTDQSSSNTQSEYHIGEVITVYNEAEGAGVYIVVKDTENDEIVLKKLALQELLDALDINAVKKNPETEDAQRINGDIEIAGTLTVDGEITANNNVLIEKVLTVNEYINTNIIRAIEGSTDLTIGTDDIKTIINGSSIDITGDGGINLTGDTTITGDASISGDVTAKSDVAIDGALSVGKTVEIGETLTVTGDVYAKNDLVVSNNADITGTLSVTGDVTAKSNVTVEKDLAVTENASVGGTLSVTGDVTAASKLTVADTLTAKSDIVAEADVDITGDLSVGGTIESTGDISTSSNLSVTGTTELTGDVTAKSNVQIDKDLTVSGNSSIQGDSAVTGNLSVTGTTELTGVLTTKSDANVEGNLAVSQNTSLSGTLSVTGKTTLSDELEVTGDISAKSDVDITGDLTVGGAIQSTGDISTESNLSVTGTTELTGDVTAKSNVQIDKNLTVGGDSSIQGNAAITGNLSITGNSELTGTLTVQDDITAKSDVSVEGNLAVSENTSLGGTLSVTGKTTLSDELEVAGDISAKSDVDITGNLSVGGTIESTGDISTSSNLSVSGNANIENDLTVDNTLYTNKISAIDDESGDPTRLTVSADAIDLKGEEIWIGNEDLTATTFIRGDLRISGSTYNQDTETLLVKDNLIVTNAGGETLTELSGLVIQNGTDTGYGIVYDPDDDVVKLGLGTVETDSDDDVENGRKFQFSGDAHPIATRADATEFDADVLVQWDATNKILVSSGSTLSDLTSSDDDLRAALDQEISDREAADTALQQALDTETTERKQTDENLQTQITTEATTREVADTALSGRIDTEESTRSAQVSSLDNRVTNLETSLQSEIETRSSTDATLAAQILAEETRATNAETALQTAIDNEAADREAADIELQEAIENGDIVAALAANLSYATVAGNKTNQVITQAYYKIADCYLAASNEELSARVEFLDPYKYNTLHETTGIDLDVRVTDDDVSYICHSLYGSFDTLGTIYLVYPTIISYPAKFELYFACTAAYDVIGTRFIYQTFRNQSSDQSIIWMTVSDSEALSELPSSGYDNVLLSEISVRTTDANHALNADVAAHIGTTDVGDESTPVYIKEGVPTVVTLDDLSVGSAERDSEGNVIVDTYATKDELTAETTRATEAETALETSLNNEISTRTSEVTRLEGLISDEETARTAADSTLQSNIESEASTREAKDTELEGLITAEEEARIAADNTLTTNLESEITRATTAENALQTALNSETTSRQEADEALQDQIDALSDSSSEALEQLQSDLEDGTIVVGEAKKVSNALSITEGTSSDAITYDGSSAVSINLAEYTIAKRDSTEIDTSMYASVYYLTKNGTQIGEDINIPKDMVLQSASLEVVEEAGVPYTDAVVGAKYIDFVLTNDQHLYLPVNDLVDVYTGDADHDDIETSTITVDSTTNIISVNKVPLSKVYFEDDLVITESLGRYSPDSTGMYTIPCTGMTLDEFFKDAYQEEAYPTTTSPSITLSITRTGYVEVGTSVTETCTVRFSEGSYTYNSSTGVTATSCTVTDTLSQSASSTSTVSNNGTYSLALPSFTVEDGTSYRVTATVQYSDGDIPSTNVGNEYPDGQITAGSLTVNSSYLYGYRAMFYGTMTSKPDEMTSADIRGLASSTRPTSGSTVTVSIPVGAMRVIFAVPSTFQITSVKDVNGMNAEIFSSFSLVTVEVEGANSYETTTYNVYYIDSASAVTTANTYTATLASA